MSSTNIEGASNKKDAEPERQIPDQNNAEQQPTTSGIGTQLNVKLTVVTRDTEEHTVRSSSLSSLDKLAMTLQNQFNKEGIRAVSITDSKNCLIAENAINSLNKTKNSKSLNDLLERLKKLKDKVAPFSAIQAHSSINTTATGSVRSINSISSVQNMLLEEREKFEDDQSFISVDPCQKEKMTTTDALTIFSMDDRTQNTIVARNDYRNRPPPPYEYSQSPQMYEYQGRAGQTPVYQQQNVEYGMGGIRDASQAPPYRAGNLDAENLFNTKAIRNKFIRKVYLILAIQLLFTFGFIVLSIYEKTLKKFIITQWPVMIAALVAFVILLITLFCYKTIRRTFPINFILLVLLTICMAYTTAGVSCLYETKIVMISMGATAGICTLLSLLACQHWFDITRFGMILCIASLIIIAFGIVAIIITVLTGSNVAYIIYACLITLLLCAYLMYDTQQILGGRRSEISPEEYILGVLTLYIDIMLIFQYILTLASYFGN